MQPPDAPRPRSCHVIKSSPTQEYGFDLHAERVRGQFIGNVDADSPAADAGLLRGDRIIAVNGVSIQQENHKDVVKRIKEDPMQCRLVVLDEDGFNWYNERGLEAPVDGDHVIDGRDKPSTTASHESVSNEQQQHVHDVVPPPNYAEIAEETREEPFHHRRDDEEEEASDLVVASHEHVRHDVDENRVEPEMHHKHVPRFNVSYNEDSLAFKPRPRICKLKKTDGNDEYGFNLHAERGKGHFIGKVDPHSIAELAGLEEGQRIVGVNNTLIFPDSIHKDVVTLIKQNSRQTELLVAYPEIDQWYKNNNVQYLFEDAETVQFSDEPSGYKPEHQHVAQNGNLSHESPIPQHRDEPIIVPKAENRFDTSYEEVHETRPVPVAKEPHTVIATTTRHNETSPAEPTPSQNARTSQQTSQQTNGAPDLFNMSVTEVRERISSRKKNDPRKENRQDLTLKQKYDIIQNL